MLIWWTVLLLSTYVWIASAEASSSDCNGVSTALNKPRLDCITLDDTCVDQQQFVTYDKQYQPSLTTKPAPTFSVKDLIYNWPNPSGNGDKFITGRSMHFPHVVIRPNSSEEACPDMQDPVFDSCHTPLVLWARWPYNLAEAFGAVYARLLRVSQSGGLERGLLPVLATPHGLRAPRYMPFFLGSLFDEELVTLADLSNRGYSCGASLQVTGSSGEAAGGQQLPRCFRHMHLCRLVNRDETAMVSAAWSLAAYYKDRIADAMRASEAGSHPWGLGDAALAPSVLRVVFASRPGADSRTLLNEEDLLAACNSWVPRQSDTAAAAAAAVAAAAAAAQAGSGRRAASEVPAFHSQTRDPKQQGWLKQGLVRLLQGSGQQQEEQEAPSEAPAWRRHGKQAPLQVHAWWRRGEQAPSQVHAWWRQGLAWLLQVLQPQGPAPPSLLNSTAGPSQDAQQHHYHTSSQSHRGLADSAEVPADAPKPHVWTSAKCVSHVFGSGQYGMLRDMGIMAQADVLICIHGAACLNGFFMPNGSSLVEVRPLGMSPGWANQYFFRQLQQERLLYWYGVDVHDPANSKPSLLEEQAAEVLNEQVRGRERHVRLPWDVLQHHLDLIAHVGRDSWRYRHVYLSREAYVTDDKKPVTARPKLPRGVGWQ